MFHTCVILLIIRSAMVYSTYCIHPYTEMLLLILEYVYIHVDQV